MNESLDQVVREWLRQRLQRGLLASVIASCWLRAVGEELAVVAAVVCIHCAERLSG